jgi:hypothetical protein
VLLAISIQLKWNTTGASENDIYQLFKASRPVDSGITVQGLCGQQGADMPMGKRSDCILWTSCGNQNVSQFVGGTGLTDGMLVQASRRTLSRLGAILCCKRIKRR